jgi:hypothetical protein
MGNSNRRLRNQCCEAAPSYWLSAPAPIAATTFDYYTPALAAQPLYSSYSTSYSSFYDPLPYCSSSFAPFSYPPLPLATPIPSPSTIKSPAPKATAAAAAPSPSKSPKNN